MVALVVRPCRSKYAGEAHTLWVMQDGVGDRVGDRTWSVEVCDHMGTVWSAPKRSERGRVGQGWNGACRLGWDNGCGVEVGSRRKIASCFLEMKCWFENCKGQKSTVVQNSKMCTQKVR